MKKKFEISLQKLTLTVFIELFESFWPLLECLRINWKDFTIRFVYGILWLLYVSNKPKK